MMSQPVATENNSATPSDTAEASSSLFPAKSAAAGEKRIRVLYFISRLDLAGTERQAVEIGSRLDPSMFRLFFASFFRTGPLVEGIRRITDVHFHIPLTSMVSPSFPLSIIKLTRFLRRNRIQVLQCFDFYTNIVGALAGRLARVPLVVTSRRHVGNTLSSRQVWLETCAFRLSDRVITNCQAAADVLINAGLVQRRKIEVIYNGIDLSNYALPAERLRSIPPAVGMLANLRPAKDHACFLRAAALVAKAHPTARFVLVGARTQNSEIQSACRDLGIADRMVLLGEQSPSRIPEILNSLSVSVLTSHGEGLPNAVLESMAAGVPVVASNVGGCRELIDDGITGFLVPAGDSQSLSEKILFLLSTPDVAEEIGRAGRARVSHINNYPGVMKQWANFYVEELKHKCTVPGT